MPYLRNSGKYYYICKNLNNETQYLKKLPNGITKEQAQKLNEAPTQQAAGYLPIGLIDVASGCPPTLQAAGYLNENERTGWYAPLELEQE